jgi:hypothetical protein
MANNTNKHDVFQLVWKSTYSINKQQVEIVVKEINDEINYQSTIALPRASTFQKKAILTNINLLRKQRDSLLAKYDDNRMPRASGGLGGDPQSTDQNYKKAESMICPYCKKEVIVGQPKGDCPLCGRQIGKPIKKSISKRELFKALYGRVWGSTDGLNPDKLEKMNEDELDEQINALEKIFDN